MEAVSTVLDNPKFSKRSVIWTGRILSGLTILALGMSGAMKLSHHPKVIEQFIGRFGFSEGLLTPIGILEISCALLYLIPGTSTFGAILVTAYLGGATVTHVRVGDPFIIPVVLGVIAWAGLYLRDERVRQLIRMR